MTFHTGVELSCRINSYLNGINVHLLVRDFDYEDEKVALDEYELVYVHLHSVKKKRNKRVNETVRDSIKE